MTDDLPAMVCLKPDCPKCGVHQCGCVCKKQEANHD